MQQLQALAPSPASPKPKRAGIDRASATDRSGRAPAPRRAPDPAELSRRVAALDRRLGQHVHAVGTLLQIQDIVVERQRYARRALEASVEGLGSYECPRYLVNPVQMLQTWPEPYPERPLARF